MTLGLTVGGGREPSSWPQPLQSTPVPWPLGQAFAEGPGHLHCLCDHRVCSYFHWGWKCWAFCSFEFKISLCSFLY